MRHVRPLLVGLFLSTSAVAAPRKIKAEMLCGSYRDGAIKAPITGKTVKLTDPVACAIHMADPKEDAHMGTVKTIRHTVDAATGKRKDVPGSSFTTDFGPGTERADFQLVMPPSKAMEDGQIAFQPCEDFDIVGSISDDLGVYYTKTIKVVQACPSPPKLKGTLACTYGLASGKSVALKAGERPPGVQTVSCTLRSKDDRLLSATNEISTSWVKWNDDGTSAPVRHAEPGTMIADDSSKLAFLLAADAWPNCQEVELAIKLVDDGAVIFTQTFHTAITCGE